MKNSFGNNMIVTLFGESHGPYIGIVMDGLAPGIPVDMEYINHQLALRRPYGMISTSRVEEDEFEIISGVFRGVTTGTPLTIIIPNKAQKSETYENAQRVARPGHADYTNHVRFQGFEDYRGGGHSSGRITAAIVAGGAIALSALKQKGIVIGTHIQKLGDMQEQSFKDYATEIEYLSDALFPTLNPSLVPVFREIIEDVARRGDSIGGILETAILGMPAGIGEPWFDSVEGLLSHALYSIPGIKGVEFGAGFEGTVLEGSQYNDSFHVTDGKVSTSSNNNGGINGGITNGMPIVFRCAVKPTPSIFVQQDSINLDSMENVNLQIEGRHDPAIIHRARVVVDSMAAIVMYDLLSGRYGADYFTRSDR